MLNMLPRIFYFVWSFYFSLAASNYEHVQYTLKDFDQFYRNTIDTNKFDLKHLPLFTTHDTPNQNEIAYNVNINQFFEHFKTLKCHNVITNYEHVNLKFEKYPLVLRRPQLAVLNRYSGSHKCYGSGCPKDNRLVWVPYGYLSTNYQNSTLIQQGNHIPCQNYSEKLVGLHFLILHRRAIDFCLRINLATYAAQSKSWNCQLDIHLLPSDLILNSMHYSKAFEIPKRIRICAVS